jgi:hypothetical protein
VQHDGEGERRQRARGALHHGRHARAAPRRHGARGAYACVRRKQAHAGAQRRVVREEGTGETERRRRQVSIHVPCSSSPRHYNAGPARSAELSCLHAQRLLPPIMPCGSRIGRTTHHPLNAHKMARC